MKLLKYSHPSANKYNVNSLYELEDLKKELSLEMIKVLFIPSNFKWEDLVEKKTKNAKVTPEAEDVDIKE